MRGFLMPALVLGLGIVSAARADEDADPLYRPQAEVERDPAPWYAPALFEKMGKPRPGEWMAAHPEPAQSFEDYVRSNPVRPTRSRHTIHLVPAGPMTARARERMGTLREFLEVYYTVPVRQGAWASLKDAKSRDRDLLGRTVTQYWTRDIMQKVLRPRLPRNGLCVLGVTMVDLYPEDSWNYVFGQATLSARVGVYSLVRFYPAFWGREETPEADRLGLKRSLQTLVHEAGHMFGVQHCQAYECVMNGSNSLAESDRRPIHLCPECLRMFRWNTGFDIPARYRALKAFYEAHDMKEEAEWVAKRLEACRGG